MTTIQFYNEATGPCEVCGEDSEGSTYWTPLPSKLWDVLRPSIGAMFKLHGGEDLPPEDRAQNVLFIPPYSKPFCSAECALKYNQENDDV